MAWHDVEQNTDEWLALKLGQPGSSDASTFMAGYNGGQPKSQVRQRAQLIGKSSKGDRPKRVQAFGDPAKARALELALEIVNSHRSLNESYSSLQMKRGHAQEPQAIALYEQQHFCTVTNGGYYDCGDWGDSPDGHVDGDGLVEVKSVIASVHDANMRRGKPDPAYKWQLLTHLDASGREWVDFVSYCEDYPEWDQLCVYRVLAKDVQEELAQLRERRRQFIELIKAKVAEINGRK